MHSLKPALIFHFMLSGVLAQQSPKPNIVFFIVDDLDKYQLGAFDGKGKVLTPNLDRLAEEGAVFHRAFVNSTVCTPSRYEFTTGRHAGRSRHPAYLAGWPEGSQGEPAFNLGLEKDGMNVGKVLADNGYATGFVGKFHMDKTADRCLTQPERTFLKTALRDDPQSSVLFRKWEACTRQEIRDLGFTWVKHVYEGNLVSPFENHNLEWTVEAALEFIQAHKDRPFYLQFNTTLTHGPERSWLTSLDHPEETGAGLIDRPLDAGMPPRGTIVQRIRAAGYKVDSTAGLTWMDDGLGAILARLKALNLEGNTLVVFLPDHGSDNKSSLFNRNCLNVPMIIRYPREIPRGTVIQSAVQGMDLVPTFYELAGAAIPAGYRMDGKSIRSLFRNPAAVVHPSLYFEIGSSRAILKDGHKYIATRYTEDRTRSILEIPPDRLKDQVIQKLSYLGTNVDISARGMLHNPEYLSPDQLYDLSRDPGERNSLAGDPAHAAKLKEMKGALVERMAALGRPFGELIPGPNARAPDGTVLRYIRNIQTALRSGATIRDGVLLCEGNCVTEPLRTPVSTRRGVAWRSPRLSQTADQVVLHGVESLRLLEVFDARGDRLRLLPLRGAREVRFGKAGFSSGIHFLRWSGPSQHGTLPIVF